MTYWRVMCSVMCSVTDKNMPVMLAVLLRQKKAKMCSFSQIMPKNVLVFPNYAKKCASTINKNLQVATVSRRPDAILLGTLPINQM